MQITNLEPFGCSITQIDLRHVNDVTAQRIGQATAERGFSVIREQYELDDKNFARFLQQIGPAMFTKGETAVPHYPTLNIVTNVGRDRPPRSVWHSDTSYVSEPPAYTALRIIEVPERGGATLIADQHAAYDALDDNTKERLAETTVLHGATGVPDATTHRHPLLRQHLETDRPTIFLSTPKRCTALSGHTPQQSRSIIENLYAFGTQDRFVYRHNWQAGDVLIWDNRRTLHRGDHSEVVGHRTLHRGMVRGEKPVAIAPRPLAKS